MLATNKPMHQFLAPMTASIQDAAKSPNLFYIAPHIPEYKQVQYKRKGKPNILDRLISPFSIHKTSSHANFSHLSCIEIPTE